MQKTFCQLFESILHRATDVVSLTHVSSLFQANNLCVQTNHISVNCNVISSKLLALNA